jgi:hypothetical protein
MSRLALGPTQPPIQWVPWALPLGVKWLGHEADHSPPFNAKIKNLWGCTSTPQYTFMAWCSVKATVTTLPSPFVYNSHRAEYKNCDSLNVKTLTAYAELLLKLCSVVQEHCDGLITVQGVLPIVYRFTSKNPSTPQGKRGWLRKKEKFKNNEETLFLTIHCFSQCCEHDNELQVP